MSPFFRLPSERHIAWTRRLNEIQSYERLGSTRVTSAKILHFAIIAEQDRWAGIGHTNDPDDGDYLDHSPLRDSHRDCLGRTEGAPGSLPAQKGGLMKEKLILPKFSTEAEEAEWWDSHHKLVEDALLEALENGETQPSMARKLTQQQARDSDTIFVQIPADYIHRVRKLAERKGIGYEIYMQMLLKEALDRESRKST